MGIPLIVGILATYVCGCEDDDGTSPNSEDVAAPSNMVASRADIDTQPVVERDVRFATLSSRSSFAEGFNKVLRTRGDVAAMYASHESSSPGEMLVLMSVPFDKQMVIYVSGGERHLSATTKIESIVSKGKSWTVNVTDFEMHEINTNRPGHVVLVEQFSGKIEFRYKYLRE